MLNNNFVFNAFELKHKYILYNNLLLSFKAKDELTNMKTKFIIPK